jgi:protein-disulfide isomerase
VKKTPTLFINGRRYEGRMDIKAIVAACQSAAAPG